MEKGANTRKKLLSDAFKLFSSNSYENVSFSELEKASGVSRGSMVYYFKNKNGLFMGIFYYNCDHLSISRIFVQYQKVAVRSIKRSQFSIKRSQFSIKRSQLG